MAGDSAPAKIGFGVFELDIAGGEICKEGRALKLAPQPLKVLALLVSRAGHIVTREEIQRIVWGEETFVDFSLGLNHCIRQIRTVLGDDAQSPRFVETLSRRGYRFVAPVTIRPTTESERSDSVARPSTNLTSSATEEPPASDRNSQPEISLASLQHLPIPPPVGKRTLSILVYACLSAVFVLMIVFSLRRWVFPNQHQGKAIRSLAVLPFWNLSTDPSQEYFAAGLTDQLITELAQIPELRVISRTSVMQYKGSRKPLPVIARELRVDAVVEGSVTRAGDRLRITVHLVKANPERHLWAKSYERSMSHSFSLQGEIATEISTEIRAKLASPERMPDSYQRPVNATMIIVAETCLNRPRRSLAEALPFPALDFCGR